MEGPLAIGENPLIVEVCFGRGELFPSRHKDTISFKAKEEQLL